MIEITTIKNALNGSITKFISLKTPPKFTVCVSTSALNNTLKAGIEHNIADITANVEITETLNFLLNKRAKNPLKNRSNTPIK